uniref:PSI-J n=1 Tax=Ditylum brightwellii TaxID=49249 RepID=A0A6S9A6U9_9STRA
MKSLSLISCLIALTAANNAVSAFAPTTPPSKSFLIAPSAATNKEILTKKSSHAFFMSSGDEVETKKETTWDRITGPKLFKTVTNWNGIHSVPLVPLRIFTGLLMVHHGSEGEIMFFFVCGWVCVHLLF